MSQPWNKLTVCQAARLLGEGTVTAEQLDASVREAIVARNPELNAYCWVAPPETARVPAATGALKGIGAAVKANIVSRGQPTDCCSRLLGDWRPPYDAAVVERLRAAGSYILGKTNMDEFGMGSSTEHSRHGISRNPFDPNRTPGGSSGGSAAAVAADLAYFALGSDTGGSIRQPAHCCGVVGLKPTYGRVSRHGLVPFASSLDQVGALTKDVADAALLYAILAGHDPRDSTSLAEPLGDPQAAVTGSVAGRTVGVPWGILTEGLETDLAGDFRETLDDLKAQGVRLTGIELPTLPFAVATYYIICTAEASANLARYDGTLYGQRQDAENWLSMVERTRSSGFGAEVKRRILLGTYVLSAGFQEAYYRRAQQARTLIRRDFEQAFTGCDAVALPTAPTAAFPLGEKLDDPVQMYLSDVFTVAANLTGLPAITVPTGLDSRGLPLSLQLMGPALGEELLLSLAGAVERTRDFRSRKDAAWNR